MVSRCATCTGGCVCVSLSVVYLATVDLVPV